MPLPHIRELLGSIPHVGDTDGGVQRLRRTLAPFYPRQIYFTADWLVSATRLSLHR